MRITYDRHTDTLHLALRPDRAVAESEEAKPGVLLDYDSDGHVVAVELLDASRHVTDPDRLEFTVADG